jgi:sugar phosphate isomerase/epimerase
MKLAIQHTLIPGDSLRERFERAAGWGFDGVEVVAWGFSGPMVDHHAEIEAASCASGLPVSSLCSMGSDDFVHTDLAERTRRLAGLVRMLELADALGAAGVVALPIRAAHSLPDFSPVMDERTLITQLAVASLRSALERTAGGRAGIFLEPLNRYEARYLRTVTQAADVCRAVGDPRVKVMADLFHMSIEEVNLAAALRAEAGLIGHVHLADSNRLLPGQGHTDFVPPFSALREMGFAGWCALECGIGGDPAEALPQAVRFIRTCWDRAGA